MKIQDVLFIGVLCVVLLMRKPQTMVYAGLACIGLAVPFFTAWIFFTAERLTWYAAVFFAISALNGLGERKEGT